MTNTLPVYVSTSFGGIAVASSPALSVTVNMPQTIRAGNLLIAICQENGSVANNTYTVNAPWNFLTQIDDGTGLQRMTVAYAYVQANGLLDPCVFTTTGTSGNLLLAQVFQYKNAKITAPLSGNSATHANHGVEAISCGAISASAGNSLAVALAFSSLSTPGWPPAGWTNEYYPTLNNQIIGAHLALVNSGDSTGAIAPGAASGSHAIINIEVLGETPPVAGDKYFNGLPAPGIDDTQGGGAEKFWWNGLPSPALFPIFVAPINPDNTGKGKGQQDKKHEAVLAGIIHRKKRRKKREFETASIAFIPAEYLAPISNKNKTSLSTSSSGSKRTGTRRINISPSGHTVRKD